MPAVSYDSLSFFHDGARAGVRRFSIVGASVDPTLLSADRWAGELARLRSAGFNTVAARVPWSLHEPTPGRFEFSGVCDVRRFIVEAGAAGLRVILRIGPCVGGSFAGGGVPGWIGEFAGDRIREANPAFMQRVTGFWQRLMREFVDLQATRNGDVSERPVIAVGLEDHWHSLDAEVGAAYFSELVRFAREFGVDVPLVSANNCWYMHEGVVDTWCRPSDDPATRMREMRMVQPEVPAMGIVSSCESAAQLAGRVAVRSDFVIDVTGGAHRDATSVRGRAERGASGLFDLRRVLVFASTFGDVLARLHPVDELPARLEVRIAKPARRGDAPQIEFVGRNLDLDGARLERCSGSLVARSGDLLVVAGKPRGKIELVVDRSTVTLTVPADGAAPKCVRVRSLRVVAVPTALAEGVGIADDGLEFVDRAGQLLVKIGHDGTVRRMKPATGGLANARNRARQLPITAVIALAERGFADGSHDRFAWMNHARSLGAYGVEGPSAFYRMRFKQSGKSPRLYALPFQRFLAADLQIDGARRAGAASEAFEIRAGGPHTVVAEVRGAGLPSEGRAVGAPVGIFGPLVELGPLKGVKREAIPAPPRDATTVGRFVCGFDLSDDAGARSLRWTFPAQKQDVVLWIPARAAAAMDAGSHVLRLNGELLPFVGPASGGTPFVVLPASKLSPMRPKKLKKGEKPPKAREAVLEPGDNELVYDGVPDAAAKDMRFFAVRGVVAAEWAFARVAPPACWAAGQPMAQSALARSTGVPTWFRCEFHLEAPSELTLRASFAAGACATVCINGTSVLVQDGASGVQMGKTVGKTSGKTGGNGASAKLVRTARVAAAETRTGANEILVFSPEGRMPELAVM